MMKLRLLLIAVLALLCLNIGQAQKWSWGPSWQVGYAGERVNDGYSDITPSLGGASYSNKTLWQPSFAAGLWVERSLGPHWALQLGLNYRWLNNTRKTKYLSINASNVMLSLSDQENIIRQQVIDLPLSVRYYFTRSNRAYRPFIDVQISAAYLVESYHKIFVFTDAPTMDPSIYVEDYYVDFGLDIENQSPWQAQAGFALGVTKGDFALSFIKNWTIPTDEVDYYYSMPGGLCISCECVNCGNRLFFAGLNWQAKILDNTSLRLQYNW